MNCFNLSSKLEIAGKHFRYRSFNSSYCAYFLKLAHIFSPSLEDILSSISPLVSLMLLTLSSFFLRILSQISLKLSMSRWICLWVELTSVSYALNLFSNVEVYSFVFNSFQISSSSLFNRSYTSVLSMNFVWNWFVFSISSSRRGISVWRANVWHSRESSMNFTIGV